MHRLFPQQTFVFWSLFIAFARPEKRYSVSNLWLAISPRFLKYLADSVYLEVFDGVFFCYVHKNFKIQKIDFYYVIFKNYVKF